MEQSVKRLHSDYIDELVRNRGLWRDGDQLDLATLGWVSWLNEIQLRSSLGDIPHGEFKAAITVGSLPAGRWEKDKTEPRSYVGQTTRLKAWVLKHHEILGRAL